MEELTVRIETKAFGTVELDEGQRISFPQGLFGFETYHDYVLIEAERQPFFWLQSVDAREIAFVIIDPFLFRPDYELDIDDELLGDIGITSPGKALVFTVVTIPEQGPMTANLQGPLIINRDTRTGKQGILTDQRWKTKHDILKEFQASKQKEAVSC
jgi:flagellar assembly factor FliW